MTGRPKPVVLVILDGWGHRADRADNAVAQARTPVLDGLSGEYPHGLLNASDGGEDSAIGHLYMLARTFRQMLVILEKNVRDSRAIWQALWQGFRMPPFAAEDLIRQARRYKSKRELTRALRLIARADLELRSQPPDKKLVLERLVMDLASEPTPAQLGVASTQYAMEL